MLNAVMLNVIVLNVVMLSVIRLNIVILSIIMLNVVMLSVIRLNIIMLSIIRLNVSAPHPLQFPRDLTKKGNFNIFLLSRCCKPFFFAVS